MGCFENANRIDAERRFCLAFSSACDMNGLVSVLRRCFKHRGISDIHEIKSAAEIIREMTAAD